jgi:hypothetical protein
MGSLNRMTLTVMGNAYASFARPCYCFTARAILLLAEKAVKRPKFSGHGTG